MIEVKPYDKLAEIYDNLMDHVDYKYWVSYIFKLFDYSSVKISDIIDLSCGTASFLQWMPQSSFNLYGCDFSLPMIHNSRHKKNIQNINVFACDVKNIPLKKSSVDVALFLYDSINYLMQKKDVIKFFNNVYDILRPGGLFIFDIVTEYQCRYHFADYYEEEHWLGSGYKRHSYYNAKFKMQINDFTIFIGNETYFEHHIQKIYLQKELENLLTKHKFSIAAVLDGFTLNYAGEKSERIHFIAKK